MCGFTRSFPFSYDKYAVYNDTVADLASKFIVIIFNFTQVNKNKASDF